MWPKNDNSFLFFFCSFWERWTSLKNVHICQNLSKNQVLRNATLTFSELFSGTRRKLLKCSPFRFSRAYGRKNADRQMFDKIISSIFRRHLVKFVFLKYHVNFIYQLWSYLRLTQTFMLKWRRRAMQNLHQRNTSGQMEQVYVIFERTTVLRKLLIREFNKQT